MPCMYPGRPQIDFMHMRVVSAYTGMMASAHRVRPDAIFHNLEKLAGAQNPFGGHGTPVPPFDDGPALLHTKIAVRN